MPTCGEPLVRAVLDALRRHVASYPHRRRNLIELDEAQAARDRADAEPNTMGGRRAANEDVPRLSALIPFCSAWQFTLTIPADVRAIPIVTDGVGELMEATHWPKEEIFAVQLALQEAVANAIRHGCRGDVSKHVHCSVSCDQSGDVIIVVRDPGPGFDASAITDPLEGSNILKPSGRGIFLIKQLMDEMHVADGGRQVQMRKRRIPGLTRAPR